VPLVHAAGFVGAHIEGGVSFCQESRTP
jgi:hypothetical protein